MKNGFTSLEIVAVLAVVAVLGLGATNFLSKRNADQSVKATKELLEKQEKLGANVAASVVKIGEANAVAPDSPSRNFIAKEVPLVQTQLPAPDPQSLLEAEKRKVAIMEGKYQLASELYEDAYARAAKLEKALEKAIEERKEVDTKLVEAAAAANARRTQTFIAGAIALILGAGWVYARMHGLGFQRVLSKFVVPTLDRAYDEGDQTVKQVLDANVFDKLTDQMDAKDKAVVHKIRASKR